MRLFYKAFKNNGYCIPRLTANTFPIKISVLNPPIISINQYKLQYHTFRCMLNAYHSVLS